MKLFTNIVALFFLASMAVAEDEGNFLYHNTQICARHKSYLCLSYDSKHSQVVLGSKHKLRFEIEEIRGINLVLNRVYTYIKDKATGEAVKSCLVRKELDTGVFGLGVSPCDFDEKELVLAVEVPDMDVSKLTTDEFVLKEISYLDGTDQVSSPYCLTSARKASGALENARSKGDLRQKSPVILSDCESGSLAFGQEFKATGFKKSESSRLVARNVELKAEVGRFCLSEEAELCLGVSLLNGTDLVNNKLIQVKNLTKNEAKELHTLKMRWYHDLQNNRIATAANLDYCLEAVYNAPIGENRAGRMQYDDVLHLGTCDVQLNADKDVGDVMRNLPKSELFYSVGVGSWTEIRTDVPTVVAGVEEKHTKCVSIVRCIKHDNDHCTPYNSVPVFEVESLEQGAHARLKDCNSEEMVSQRFNYYAEKEITLPPTHSPTTAPPTASPTFFPTEPPVVVELSSSPTPKPTFFVEPVAPTVEVDSGEGTSDNNEPVLRQSTGLLAALAFVGFLCLLILLLALAYYYKHRGEFAGLPEEDENFIARV